MYCYKERQTKPSGLKELALFPCSMPHLRIQSHSIYCPGFLTPNDKLGVRGLGYYFDICPSFTTWLRGSDNFSMP
jgi:hypothetical protein